MRPFRFFFLLAIGFVLLFAVARIVIVAMIFAAIMSIIFYGVRTLVGFFRNLDWDRDQRYSPEWRRNYNEDSLDLYAPRNIFDKDDYHSTWEKERIIQIR